MPPVRPLIVRNGQIQQAAASDTLDIGISEVDVISLQNSGTAAAAIGRAVYVSGSSTFGLASANATATKGVVGLVRDTSIAAGASGNIQTDGVLSATAAQWSAVTSEQNGLTPGATYYLSATTPGAITSTPPSTTGQYVVTVGIALSSTVLDIRDSGFDILL